MKCSVCGYQNTLEEIEANRCGVCGTSLSFEPEIIQLEGRTESYVLNFENNSPKKKLEISYESNYYNTQIYIDSNKIGDFNDCESLKKGQFFILDNNNRLEIKLDIAFHKFYYLKLLINGRPVPDSTSEQVSKIEYSIGVIFLISILNLLLGLFILLNPDIALIVEGYPIIPIFIGFLFILSALVSIYGKLSAIKFVLRIYTIDTAYFCFYYLSHILNQGQLNFTIYLTFIIFIRFIIINLLTQGSESFEKLKQVHSRK